MQLQAKTSKKLIDNLTANHIKIMEYRNAMEKYNRSLFYNKFGLFISTIIILLQATSCLNLFMEFHSINLIYLLLTFVISYVITDFINGLIHMYMDNNTNYTSYAGPFIAAFHLHHKTPQYKNQNALAVYFYESGTKYWLVVWLLVLILFQHTLTLNFYFNFACVTIGVLSSFAEVSHYWCHNSRKNQKFITLLQKYYILLPKKHHAQHHRSDNKNYAFLNGVTDPVINVIADFFYEGYKNSSDQHALSYYGIDSSNRN